MEPRTRYSVNDGDGLVAAAALGLGMVQLPHHMVKDEVDAGKLEEGLVPFRPKPLPISLLYPADRHIPKWLALLPQPPILEKRFNRKKRGSRVAHSSPTA